MATPITVKYFGLFSRRERWGLSLRGWLLLVFCLAALATLYVFSVHHFLAQTRRENTRVLVVEGWVRDFGINAAIKEFADGHYAMIYTTGGPIAGTDGFTNDFNTSASVGADRLIKGGIPAGLVQMVPSHVAGRDRTYSSAVALRKWFQEHDITVQSFNVITEDAHARRTRLLFQEAFGQQATVGIVSVQNPDYDPKRWWRYSEGVREILGESIAYAYAEFIFHPRESDQHVP